MSQIIENYAVCLFRPRAKSLICRVSLRAKSMQLLPMPHILFVIYNMIIYDGTVRYTCRLSKLVRAVLPSHPAGGPLMHSSTNVYIQIRK